MPQSVSGIKKPGRLQDRVRWRLGFQFGSSQFVTSRAATSASTMARDTKLASPLQQSRSGPAFPPGGSARGVTPEFATASELPSEARSLWAKSLAGLTEGDKAILQTDKAMPGLDIDDLLHTIKEKREICVGHQWEFRFKSRVINFRDKADKILSWLVKFKEVGDIAIQYNPGHAALPWAGIRFLLQVGFTRPFPTPNANHHTDCSGGAGSHGNSPHRCRKIGEYHQPMPGIRDTISGRPPTRGNGERRQAGIQEPGSGFDKVVHCGIAIPCEGLSCVRQKRTSESVG